MKTMEAFCEYPPEMAWMNGEAAVKSASAVVVTVTLTVAVPGTAPTAAGMVTLPLAGVKVTPFP